MALKLVLQNVKDYGMYLKCSFKYFQTRQTHCIKRMDWLSAWWLSHPFSHFPYSTHFQASSRTKALHCWLHFAVSTNIEKIIIYQCSKLILY